VAPKGHIIQHDQPQEVVAGIFAVLDQAAY